MEREALLSGLVQPGDRSPAPGSLRLVQAFVNTVDREHGPDCSTVAAGLVEWLERQLLPARVSAGDLEALPRSARRCARSCGSTTASRTSRARRRCSSGRRGARGSSRLPALRRGARTARRRDRRCGGARAGRRVRRDARRQLEAAEGVPGRPLRLGVLRPLEQRERHLVLDAGLRRARQGRRVLPPPPRRRGH